MPSRPFNGEEPIVMATSSQVVSTMVSGGGSAISEPSASHEKLDHSGKGQRNRGHSKIKLLVRSHAMRESASPPREANGTTPTSPNAPRSADSEKSDKSTGRAPSYPRAKQLNNNESMPDGNVRSADDSKQVQPPSSTSQNVATGESVSPSTASTGKPAPGDDRNCECPSDSSECGNNCAKSNRPESVSLLETPAIVPKSRHGLQHSPKSTNLARQLRANQRKCEQQKIGGPSCACNCICNGVNQCGNNTLSVGRPGSRHKLRHDSGSRTSFDSPSPGISRDNSVELYTDGTGIDLEQFIVKTLNSNQKNRTVLLRIERELVDFAKDRGRACHKFPNMSSYNRMLVHRVAAYFGMEHNVDQSGLCVVVTRTKNTRIPEARFKDNIRDDIILAEEPKRSILKRDSNSFEDSFNFKSPDRFAGDCCRRSKSFEEREEEYERARRRIFKDSSCESNDMSSWPWSSGENSDAPAKSGMISSLPGAEQRNRPTTILKVESFHGQDTARSDALRPVVPKSFSFGGYTTTGLSRDNSITSTRSAGARLTKQDSGTSTCSRLSPSSSGYKSQSQRSDTTVSPSPSPSPVMPGARALSQVQSQELVLAEPSDQTVIWAVTNISSVPPGSIIIDPRTNSPYKNTDGTIYRFDPQDPPKMAVPPEKQIADDPEKESPSLSRPPPLPTTPRLDHKKRSQSKSTPNETGLQKISTPVSPSTTYNGVPQQITAPVVNPTDVEPLVKTSTYDFNQSPRGSYVASVPTTQATVQAYYSSARRLHGLPSPINVVQGPSRFQLNRINGQPEMICNQQPVLARYPMSVQPPVQSFEEIPELSGTYAAASCMYDQRGNVISGEQRCPSTHAYQTPPQAVNNQSSLRVQPTSSCWQPHPSQISAQQAVYLVPPTSATVPTSHNSTDTRQHVPRLATAHNFSTPYHPGVTMTNQATHNYVAGYPVPTMPTMSAMQTVQTMPSPPGDFAYQAATHVIPAYYAPQQSVMQPAPVVYGVPTPPNTPPNHQVPGGVSMMYVNSNSYVQPSTLFTGGATYSQLGTNTSQPNSSYLAPTLVPSIMLRHTVPMTGMPSAATTPSNFQKTSRSPTPGHDMYTGCARERNSQQRYPLPVYQGVHVLQGMTNNPRLQYSPVAQPPSVMQQGCPRGYRPPSFAVSVPSDGSRKMTQDSQTHKFRKQRNCPSNNSMGPS